MSFLDIERIIKGMLPKSAQLEQWWANEDPSVTRHVQSLAWTKAGYDARLLDGEQVLFSRRL